MLYGVVLLDMQTNLYILETVALAEWKDLAAINQSIMMQG